MSAPEEVEPSRTWPLCAVIVVLGVMNTYSMITAQNWKELAEKQSATLQRQQTAMRLQATIIDDQDATVAEAMKIIKSTK